MADNLLNSEEFKSMSKEEQQKVLDILKEYEKNGVSNTLDTLVKEDYLEQPVDIETFLTDDNYLGIPWKDAVGNSKLYPFWLDILKKLFPDPYSISVNNLIESGARGLGKSDIAASAIGTYMMYRVMCLKDPLSHFGLKATDNIFFVFMNITQKAAEKIAMAKFQGTVQLSPWFMKRGMMTSLNNRPHWIPPEPIKLIIGSQPSDVIGIPIFYAFFDEISFIKNQDIDRQKEIAIDLIDTAIGGMKTRYIRHGINPTLLVLASSKRSEKSFLETHTKKKLETEEENILLVDEPVWKVKPKGTYKDETFKVAVGNKFLTSVIMEEGATDESYIDKGYTKILNVPIDFKPEFSLEIDRALCDYAGISSSELSKYISINAIKKILNDSLHNPFEGHEELTIGNAPEDKMQYYDFFNLSAVPKELKSKPMFIHMDMSISGNATGIAGVWIKGKKHSSTNMNQAKELFFTPAFAFSVKAPKGWQVSFEKNRNFIYWLKEQGFNIKTISTDSFQSYDTGQALAAKGYDYQQISVDRVDGNHICVPYQYLKSTIYEERMELFPCEKLIEEMVDLERNINTGKVDHPDHGAKDISDALCGATYSASQHAEEYAYDYGESLDTMLTMSNAITNDNLNKKQVMINYQEELKRIFGDALHNDNPDMNNDNSGNNKISFVPPSSDGIIFW